MTNLFKYAIVRKPSQSMVNGITEAELGKPIYEKALEQHSEYIKALEKCGLEVTILEPLKNFPDSCFIEDASICTPQCAIITNPGASSRNGEIVGMKDVLNKFYNDIEEIVFPGTLDGGDVMMVKDHFYIGLSDRTNVLGADQLISILEKYGMTGSAVEMKKMLHLKTGINYIENKNFLVSGEFIYHPTFNKLNKYIVPDNEAYAANSLWINDTVIVPTGFSTTKKMIEDLGYNTMEVDTSEFRKLDGGLSCLSLRF
ncbi:MAG: N(G),N(G)-dimethylarginine dimethylaminohydrolase [Candidatus Delongbacteria bacterium]|nr:N(G),N(G)-dimethylarginine dimethylaminohydrolase [Candidatus Delongbacteria bacterium]